MEGRKERKWRKGWKRQWMARAAIREKELWKQREVIINVSLFGVAKGTR